MCDLVKERKRINELLFLALSGEAARSCEDAGQLSEVALRALREHYDDKCPDECIRKRCEEFAHSVLPPRRHGSGAAEVSASKSTPRARRFSQQP